MCFDNGDSTPESVKHPPLPETGDYPGGAEGDTAYKEALRRYWLDQYKGDDSAAGREVERAMERRFAGFSAERKAAVAAQLAGTHRPARAIVFDVKGARQALARSRGGMLATGTLGLPGAYGPRKTLLGGV